MFILSFQYKHIDIELHVSFVYFIFSIFIYLILEEILLWQFCYVLIIYFNYRF